MVMSSGPLSIDNDLWFAICTKPAQEQGIARYLANLNFRVFNPQYSPTENRHDFASPMAPIFPGYVFVQGGMDRRKTILTTPGVYTIACFGAETARLPGIVLQTIRRALDCSLHIEPKPYVSEERMSKAQTVIRKGPLAGAVGIIEGMGSAYDLVISLGIIAKSVAIRIDPSWLCIEVGSASPYFVAPALARGTSVF